MKAQIGLNIECPLQKQTQKYSRTKINQLKYHASYITLSFFHFIKLNEVLPGTMMLSVLRQAHCHLVSLPCNMMFTLSKGKYIIGEKSLPCNMML